MKSSGTGCRRMTTHNPKANKKPTKQVTEKTYFPSLAHGAYCIYNYTIRPNCCQLQRHSTSTNPLLMNLRNVGDHSSTRVYTDH